jgi:LmbE family N-acetylglucosaminyl deacetylase
MNMRWICISPHLDDAVLSCGGWINSQTRQGQPVEIWTICAGHAPPGEISPLAQVCHFQWGTGTADETVALRRREDEQAATLLGATVHHFDVPDCIYRRGAQGEYYYPQDVFTTPHPQEEELVGSITQQLHSSLREGDRLLCPFAIGGHVDHLMVRQAVEDLSLPLVFYADIPYLLKDASALEVVSDGMHPEMSHLSEKDLLAWQEAVAAYRSQIAVLFGTEEDMRRCIRSYWADGHGLRLWQRGR